MATSAHDCISPWLPTSTMFGFVNDWGSEYDSSTHYHVQRVPQELLLTLMHEQMIRYKQTTQEKKCNLKLNYLFVNICKYCTVMFHCETPSKIKKPYNCSMYLKSFLIFELSIWTWCWPKIPGFLILILFFLGQMTGEMIMFLLACSSYMVLDGKT